MKGVRPESAEGEAALKLSGNYIREWTSMFKASATMERESIISADLVTDALNAFFKTTDKAGIPTILVLDDFDEFASPPQSVRRSPICSRCSSICRSTSPPDRTTRREIVSA